MDRAIQTDKIYVGPTPSSNSQLNQMHIDLVSRINELEIQNTETQHTLTQVLKTLTEFKSTYERTCKNQTDTDVLLRNMKVFS